MDLRVVVELALLIRAGQIWTKKKTAADLIDQIWQEIRQHLKDDPAVYGAAPLIVDESVIDEVLAESTAMQEQGGAVRGCSPLLALRLIILALRLLG